MRLLPVLVLLALPAAARELPRPALHYRIEVRLDPATRGLAGREEIRLRSDAVEPLQVVPLHLYLNAFAHPRTTWMTEADVADVLATYPDPWGFVEPRRIVQRTASGDRELAFAAIQPDDANPLDRTLVEVKLAEEVPRGGELVLAIDFEGRLPVPFNRTGATPQFVMAAQFYPKLAALVDGSFRAHQFHASTEFFADFADYEVWIDAPGLQVIGSGLPVPSGDGRRAFRATAVHDFVFAAAPELQTESFVLAPASGDPVEVRIAGPPAARPLFPRARAAVTFALDFLSARLPPYPWESLTVVLPPWAARRTAGMEYPGLLVGPVGDALWEVGPARDLLFPEAVLVHETAHQWFQGLVASDEVEAAFLDEGLASYAELRILEAMSKGASLGSILGFAADDEARRRLKLVRTPVSEPIAGRPSFQYAPGTWDAQVYARMSLTLRTAERLFGTTAVDRLLRDYTRAGAFRHPDLRDLLTAASLQPGVPGLLPFLEEAMERPDVPGYRVTSATSEPARRRGGEIQPSWVAEVASGGEAAAARVELAVDAGHAAGGEGSVPSDVEVLLQGPGWRNLPVEVELAFADGTVLRDRWDGYGTWRRYRLVAPAALVAARVDPGGNVALDPDRADNARAVRPHAGFTADLAAFLSQVAALLLLGVAS